MTIPQSSRSELRPRKFDQSFHQKERDNDARYPNLKPLRLQMVENEALTP